MKNNSMILLVRLHVFVMATLLLFGSCSKQSSELGVEGDSASLIINVAGVKSNIDNLQLNASVEKGNMIGLESKEYINKESVKNGRITMDVITTQDLLGVNHVLEGNGLDKMASSSPVVNNVKYIFVLQRVDDDSFTHVEHYSVGGPRNISNLVTNIEYRWYAYSYLTEENVNIPNPSVSTSIPTFHDKPLVHASGQFKAKSGQNQIAIVFDHQLTQLNIEVNVKKAYANITNLKGRIVDRDTKVKTGDFNFITKAKANHTAAIIASPDLVFENKNPDDNSIKVAKHYTSDPSLTGYDVVISELSVEYRDGTIEILTPQNGGALSFTGFQPNNSGHVLQGKLNLTFTLPRVRIIAFSNNNASNGYRLHTGTGAGDFLRNTKWFGPNSDYVAIDGVSVDPINSVNEAGHSSSDQRKVALLLANPANYPEILIIANYYNYLDEASWNAVRRYLDAGGIVLHTQDENETNISGVKRADQFMSNLLGKPVTIIKNPHEDSGVYKFTDRAEAENDHTILQGVFGDVSNYHWGQDRSGTVYVRGYSGNDLIVYSDHAQNFSSQPSPGIAFFRHKTKKYFYVGDGGFYLNPSKGDNNTSNTAYPFRSVKTGSGMDKPIITTFGVGAKSGSPTYTMPATSGLPSNYYRTSGRYEIANSMMFGNIMAWMMEQAYFNPVNKTGPIVVYP